MSVLTGHAPLASSAPLPLLVSVNSPAPTGSIGMVSADPQGPLDIHYGYLSSPAGSARLREAVRITVDLLSTKAFRAVGKGPHDLDRRTVADDHLLDRWIRERLGTTLHACGTTTMGPAGNPDAVVDQFGRVHGLDGLRIANTSILPSAPLSAQPSPPASRRCGRCVSEPWSTV
jgi:choline dehydrogenase-like flavoprotein